MSKTKKGTRVTRVGPSGAICTVAVPESNVTDLKSSLIKSANRRWKGTSYKIISCSPETDVNDLQKLIKIIDKRLGERS
jgi:hypothetical protein